jgi:hypothetical protein
MATDLQYLQEKMLRLSPTEQLRLARWLLDHATISLERQESTARSNTNGLLALAGLFDGGPGDTAERAEEILQAEMGQSRISMDE